MLDTEQDEMLKGIDVSDEDASASKPGMERSSGMLGNLVMVHFEFQLYFTFYIKEPWYSNCFI